MVARVTKRVILAAGKLALFYVALVAVGFVVFMIGFLPRDVGVDIGAMIAGLAIPCAVAFLLLAVARRWGLLSLWAILGALWCWMLVDARALSLPRQLPLDFMLWSVFALPLWIIGQVGIPVVSSRRISPSMAMLIGWAILLITPQLFDLGRILVYPSRPWRAADWISFMWAPMPLILSAFAVRHVWRGTATSGLTTASSPSLPPS